MLISTKTVGSKKPLFADFSVPLPPDFDNGGDGSWTLGDLIALVVRHEVEAFRKRQSERQFIKVLTSHEIEEGVAKGRVQMGTSEITPQTVNVADAIATALTAFEDGLFLVIIDEKRYHNLDEAVFVTPDSRLTFIRLTLLSGA